MSWDYYKKIDSDDIINIWKMTFQALDGKERHFLNLLDDNFNIIKPLYIKEGSWLQFFGYLNLLWVYATRAIINHAPIGKYRLRLFPSEKLRCLYGNYPIKSRRHILYDCMRFNGYWNPRQDSLSHFVMFLVVNPNAFMFIDNATLITPS